MFLTIYMHQFGWLSERGGNFLNLLQKEGDTQKGEVTSENGGSNPGGNYDLLSRKEINISRPELCTT